MSKNYCYYCKCEVGEFNKDNPYILLASSHHVYICFSCAKSNMPQELFNFLTTSRNGSTLLPIPMRIDWGGPDSLTFTKLSVKAFDTGSLGLK